MRFKRGCGRTTKFRPLMRIPSRRPRPIQRRDARTAVSQVRLINRIAPRPSIAICKSWPRPSLRERRWPEFPVLPARCAWGAVTGGKIHEVCRPYGCGRGRVLPELRQAAVPGLRKAGPRGDLLRGLPGDYARFAAAPRIDDTNRLGTARGIYIRTARTL